jgi:hypothetical protein
MRSVALEVQVINCQSAQLAGSQAGFRRKSIPCAVRLFSPGKNELDFALRKEESLPSYANRAPYGCEFLSKRVLLSWRLSRLSMGFNTLFATD